MMKIINGFGWLPINEKAKEVYMSGLFELYRLHPDGSESLCESFLDLDDAICSGDDIAIECGEVTDPTLKPRNIKIDPELQVKIKNVSASHYLSSGSYSDFTKVIAGKGEEAEQEVVICEAYEDLDLDVVMTYIDDIADSIEKLIKEL